MFNTFILLTKMTVSMIWLAFILSSTSLFSDDYNSVFVMLGILLFLIHIIEYIVVKLMTVNEISFIQTMIFGYGHWLPILKN